MNFNGLGLKDTIIKGLEQENIKEPTPVQEMVIPLILKNEDVIMQSQTGSGKTLAYLLPIYQRQPEEVVKGMQVIILVPTHELAMQVHEQVKGLSVHSGIELRSAVLFGDVNIQRQIETLREKQQIIIGTSNRIAELIGKKKVTAHTIATIVIDEADKMLDKQNLDGVKAIRKAVMRDTQVVMASASIPQTLLEKVGEITKNPKIIKTEESFTVPDTIKHRYVICEGREKLEMLRKLIHAMKPRKSIVFINHFGDIERATEKLQYHHMKAGCIHGKNVKQERQKILTEFKTGKLDTLIATDLAARGLHIDGVDAVFSLSISQEPLEYMHRSGRVGRNGNKGLSVCIVTKEEASLMEKYENKLGISMVPIKLRDGKIMELAKK